MNNESPTNLYKRLVSTVKAFSPIEKIIFSILAAIAVGSALYLAEYVNKSHMTDVPVQGGDLKEGIIGYASFINPVLAYTDADKDLVALVYSGLLKATPGGTLVPDLAESWTVSGDGLTYDFKIRPDAYFQDGVPVTADDVVFTIKEIQDPVINSPKALDWNGVSVAKVNDREVTFTLKQPYPAFLENMTLGILPKHKWANIEPQLFERSAYNQEPVGSGPYMIHAAQKDSGGLYKYYDLVPFERYLAGTPYISHIIVRFYDNEADAVAAYKGGVINSLAGISPAGAMDLAEHADADIKSVPLPRIFAVFFNQNNNPVLLNKEVRQALDAAVDKDALIDQVFSGYAVRAPGPIPVSLMSATERISPDGPSSDPRLSALQGAATGTASTTSGIAAAKKILESAGWKPNANGILTKQVKNGKSAQTETLSFTLSTANTPELKQTASILQADWQAIGANVTLSIFDPSDLNEQVIKQRKYDALLFGNVIGRDLDLYQFWDSSERNYPGLNVAQYANPKTDKLLETARSTASSTVRAGANEEFQKELLADVPAVFLYSPDFTYALPKYVKNVFLGTITSPSERFLNINTWYIETEGVWNMFVK